MQRQNAKSAAVAAAFSLLQEKGAPSSSGSGERFRVEKSISQPRTHPVLRHMNEGV
jgi:hypothetical protein